MASFLSLSKPRTTILVGFSDYYRLPSVSICGVPVHSNLAQAIVYEISKHRLLHYWADWKLTHMKDWDVIEFSPFEQSRDKTAVHMLHFITKCMSNTLSTMAILQWQGYASTNLCPCCGTVPETIQHIYQCNHEVSWGRWTASVYALQKWLETQNMDPNK